MEKFRYDPGQLIAVADSFCKINRLRLEAGLGRKPLLQTPELIGIFFAFITGRVRDFKSFYDRLGGFMMRTFFKKTPSYSSLIRRLSKIGELLPNMVNGEDQSGFYVIDSTAFALCQRFRFHSRKLFPEFADWTASSTGWTFGFKLHLVVNALGKIIAWRISNGSKHDIAEAENLLRRLKGTAIGDRGYCSCAMRKRLAENGLDFIARAKSNMHEQNTEKELKLLERRYLVELVIRKLKNYVGNSFSRFRAWSAVCGIAALGIILINLSL